MRRSRTPRLLAPALATAALAAAGAPAASAAPAPLTPIAHFLMLMQEGHSFDNYFGSFPGADGIPRGTCVPVDPLAGATPCVRPFRLGERSAVLPHDAEAFATQYRDGHMDGFVQALAQLGVEDPRAPMGHYDQRDIPYYWNLAAGNVLFDRYFAASTGGSVPNHMQWLTGTDGWAADPERLPPSGFGRPTVFDRLQARGVPWKVYVEDYDPRITYRTAPRANQVRWMPLLAFPRFLREPRLCSRIVDLSELFTDADRGRLPAVAYVVPQSSSEHPPGSVDAGVRLVRRLVNALSLSPQWRSSALLVTYDNAGGWYDHVRPPRIAGRRDGFRVPALLVSPYARSGVVDHQTLDSTSALRFVEDNWGLAPLVPRERRAPSLAGAFDFPAGARPPVILGLTRHPPRLARVDVGWIYAGYGGAALVTVLLATRAVVLGRRRLVSPRRAEGVR